MNYIALGAPTAFRKAYGVLSGDSLAMTHARLSVVRLYKKGGFVFVPPLKRYHILRAIERYSEVCAPRGVKGGA